MKTILIVFLGFGRRHDRTEEDPGSVPDGTLDL